MIRLIALFFSILLCVSCTKEYPSEMVAHNGINKLDERQQFLQKQANFNLSKVSVARLAVNGTNYEVTSLLPVRVASFKSDEANSLTLFVFNTQQDKLILFTRDGTKNKGYEVQLQLSDFKDKKEILFPIIDTKNGTTTDQVISLNELLVR